MLTDIRKPAMSLCSPARLRAGDPKRTRAGVTVGLTAVPVALP